MSNFPTHQPRTALTPNDVEQAERLNGVKAVIAAALKAAFGDFDTSLKAMLGDLREAESVIGDLGWLSTTPGLLNEEMDMVTLKRRLLAMNQALSQYPGFALESEHNKTGEQRELSEDYFNREMAAKEEAMAAERAERAKLASKWPRSAEEHALMQKELHDPNGFHFVDYKSYLNKHLEGRKRPKAPIRPSDFDPMKSAGGDRLVATMRQDSAPFAAPAAALQGHLVQILMRETGLNKKDAQLHAEKLTNIFLIALRRAMGASNIQMWVSADLAMSPDIKRVQDQFGRELIVSWYRYLEELPVKQTKQLEGSQCLLEEDSTEGWTARIAAKLKAVLIRD